MKHYSYLREIFCLKEALLLTGCFIAGVLHADELLSESFIPGERRTNNLPNTAYWYSSTYNSALADTNGLYSPAYHHLVAYFTESGSPQQLNVGDSLIATVEFSLKTPVSGGGGLRIGLFNSRASRISADSLGTSAAAFSNYTGYASFYNLGMGTAGNVQRRDDGISSALMNSLSSYTSLGSSSGVGDAFISGANYTTIITLCRTASGMEISVTLDGVDGYSYSYVDTSGSTETVFDTIAVYGAGATGGYTLKTADITYFARKDILLVEEFDPTERLLEDLPETAYWYSSTYNSALADTNGLYSPAYHHLVAYFTESGSPQQLNVGDSLIATVEFSLETPVSGGGGLRIGLFNSGASRISADSLGTSAAAFSNYTGYASFYNLGMGTAGNVQRRDDGISSSLINSLSSYTSLGSSSGAGAAFTSGTNYTTVITLRRTAGGMEISVTLDGVDGYSYSYVDTSGSTETVFDTIAVYGAGATGGYTLKAVDICRTPFQKIASNATYGCRRPHGYGLYDETVNKTFVCWNGPGMSVMGRAYDHSTAEWSAEKTIAPLSYYGTWDYHNYPNMAQMPDGRLIVAWVEHSVNLQIARAAVSHDLTGTWNSSIISTNNNTYPMVFTHGSVVYIFYSVSDDISWPYRSFGYIKSTDNGDTWTDHICAIDSGKQDPNRIDEVYAFHFHIVPGTGSSPDRVQFTWEMRGGPNGHAQGSRNIYFAYFVPSTGMWEGVDGSNLGEWISLSEMLSYCLVQDTGPVFQSSVHCITSSHFESGTPLVIDDLSGMAAQSVWTGSQWQRETISSLSPEAIRRMPDGRQRLLLTSPMQSSMTILESDGLGGEWLSVFEDSIRYEDGADRTWSMGFIDDGQAEVDILMSQIRSSQSRSDYSGKWPVWAVDTRFGF